MTESPDVTDPDPEQQDPESAPASDEDADSPAEPESTGDPGLDRQVERLEHTGDKVAGDIEETRRDWQSKQEEAGLPGADEDEDTSRG